MEAMGYCEVGGVARGRHFNRPFPLEFIVPAEMEHRGIRTRHFPYQVPVTDFFWRKMEMERRRLSASGGSAPAAAIGEETPATSSADDLQLLGRIKAIE